MILLGCASRTKFWSSDFCSAPKLNLGLDNFFFFTFYFFSDFGILHPHVINDFHCIPIWSYTWLYSRNLVWRRNEGPWSRKILIFFTSYLGQGLKEKFEFEKKYFGHTASYIPEICDSTGVKDPEVGRLKKKIKMNLSYQGQGWKADVLAAKFRSRGTP